MRKYFIILAVFALFIGCGRVGTQNDSLDTLSTNSSSKDNFDVIVKSQYLQNSSSYIKQGHYSLLFKYSGNSTNLDGVLYENGSNYSSSESGEAKVVIDPSSNSITNNILLLLDFSGSIITDSSLRTQLKTSVKYFIDGVSDKNVKIAIYYLNSKETITPIISEPTAISTRLVEEIDRLDDSYFEGIIEENLISTNLYGGIIKASEIACNWVGNCTSDVLSTPTFNNDNFEFASVAVFTDGRDQAAWAEKSEMIAVINKNKSLFYQAVGVGDADKDLIEDISSDAGIYEEELNADSIQTVFDKLTIWANSFYEARYCPAAQKGSVDIKIDVQDNGGVIGTIEESSVSLSGSDEFRCDL